VTARVVRAFVIGDMVVPGGVDNNTLKSWIAKDRWY
jgi:hypothetical protein